MISALAATLSCAACAADSASVEFGSGNKTDMTRIALQWQWERRWGKSSKMHLTGYWDLNLGYWRGQRYRGIEGQRQNLTVLGITPVFRLQQNTLHGFYGEAGIGVNHLSGYYDNNDRQLSTQFQFGDHIGIGYVFRNRLDLSYRFQHFSNGSIRRPNDGVNFSIIRLSYPFD